MPKQKTGAKMALIPAIDKTGDPAKPAGIDINKLITNVRSTYKKEKGLAEQVGTGQNITKPTEDRQFVTWKGSHWEQLVGIKGLPFGYIIQIAGRPDSGKSSHAMAFMKQAQDQDVLVIFWDAEKKFSPKRFDNHFKGKSDDLVWVGSKIILEGGDQVEKVIHAAKEQNPNCKILIVWDSVGGSLAKNEEEGSLLDGKQMAAAAKENGAVVRAFTRLMEKYKNRDTNEDTIAVLLINQVYANIGSPGQKESGGQKVEYHSSIIIQLTRKSDVIVTRKGEKYKKGIKTRAKVRKNHLFDGEDSIAELILEVTAGDITVADKSKKSSDPDEDNIEE